MFILMLYIHTIFLLEFTFDALAFCCLTRMFCFCFYVQMFLCYILLLLSFLLLLLLLRLLLTFLLTTIYCEHGVYQAPLERDHKLGPRWRERHVA